MQLACHSGRCRMAGQPMETTGLTLTQKDAHYMWIHWQRWVMWAESNTTLGNGKMHSGMDKARRGWQMHAHLLASLIQTEWSRENSMNSKKMALSLSLKFITMLKMIGRMIYIFLIRNQLKRLFSRKETYFWKVSKHWDSHAKTQMTKEEKSKEGN
jgi:hypothetical protein